MKVAAFSRARIESGKAGFNPENTVVFRFYESVNRSRTEKDDTYDEYAGGYISLIRDLDFSEPENNIAGYEDYLPEADVLARSIFREFSQGQGYYLPVRGRNTYKRCFCVCNHCDFQSVP